MKTAQDTPEMPAGTYGASGYHPGIDDPTQLPPQFYAPPQWDPYAWPKWALPTGLIAGGVLGFMGLRGLGRRLRGQPGIGARLEQAAAKGIDRIVTASAGPTLTPHLARVVRRLAETVRGV
jgi:hypothetical protein